MSTFDIVRAWKDTEYRQSLSAEEQALVPAHPAGPIELADEELLQAGGSDVSSLLYTLCNYCTLNTVCQPPLLD